MAGALCVFAGTEEEVEFNGDQFGDMVGSGVKGGSCRGNDGVHNSKWGDLFSSDGGIFKPLGLEFPRKALVDTGVCLRFNWFSSVGQTIQEVGSCNCPPCLRN